jgi:pyruvate dehydrogenase E2 component (dihydrolipoamide acetyltransferase)
VPTEVVMPALGVAQETGKLLRWLKTEGDSVEAGEPLMEIETDKVTVGVEAPGGGTLTDVRVHEGEEVPVGTVVALILGDGELPPSGAEASSEVGPGAPSRVDETEPAPPEPATTGGVPKGGAPRTGTRRDRKPASPLARRRAREAGIDLSVVRGTGPGGAVTVDDLEAGVTEAQRSPEGAREEPPSGAAPPIRAVAEEIVTPSGVWQRMAERTVTSWRSAPHFFLFRDVDGGRLLKWLEMGRRSTDQLTVTDLLVKLTATALRLHPEINARWENGSIVRSPAIEVGIAVAIDEGLVVPILHRPDELTLEEISARRQDLVSRARAGSLRLEDVQGGTFTISNLGSHGVDAFVAVINPPQAAILAVGRVGERVVAEEGRPAVRKRMTLALSCDHRVVDGARAARFLETVADLIEEPLGLLG